MSGILPILYIYSFGRIQKHYLLVTSLFRWVLHSLLLGLGGEIWLDWQCTVLHLANNIDVETDTNVIPDIWATHNKAEPVYLPKSHFMMFTLISMIISRGSSSVFNMFPARERADNLLRATKPHAYHHKRNQNGGCTTIMLLSWPLQQWCH